MILEILINSFRDPKEELSETFGKVAHATYDNVIDGAELHTSCIPGLYTLNPAHSPHITKLRDMFNMPRYWEVSTLQGHGLTREDSIEDLHGQIIQRAMCGGISLLQNQKGQHELPVALGGIYKSIHREDKQHDHNDPRIANFIAVYFDPLKGLVKGSMDDAHSHLWVGHLKP